MPTENDGEDESGEMAVPKHPALELVAECVQSFNKCKQ